MSEISSNKDKKEEKSVVEKPTEKEVAPEVTNSLQEKQNNAAPHRRHWILPLVTILISVGSLVFAWNSNQLAKEANHMANKALETTKSIFLIEKRPYLNITVPEYEDNQGYIGIFETEEGSRFAHRLEINNEGGIPAKDVEVTLYRLESSEEGAVQTVSIVLPDFQKILPGKSNTINTSFGDLLKAGSREVADTTSLTFQAQIKQFRVTKNKVTLIGNLGEFR